MIPTVNDVTEQDEVTLGRLFTVAAKIAKEEGIAEDGYRLIVNCNKTRWTRSIPYSYASCWW